MHLPVVLSLLASMSWLGPTLAQSGAQSSCGATVTVAPGDTLSRIAERCDVSEGAILRANPRVRGSDDLRVGMELRLTGNPAGIQVDQSLNRLRSYASKAVDELEGFARSIESSVEDLLDANPDLHQRLLRLGDRLNVTGIDAGKAQVSIEPGSGAPGSAVTLSALGLPPSTVLAIGAGAPRAAYQVLDRARTSPDGTLRTTVRVPEWAGDALRLAFVIAAEDGTVRVRSAPFTVTAR